MPRIRTTIRIAFACAAQVSRALRVVRVFGRLPSLRRMLLALSYSVPTP